MTTLRSISLLFCLVMLLAACSKTMSPAVIDETKAVMNLHDEAMALMDPVFDVRSNLKRILKKMDATAVDSTSGKEINYAIGELDVAEEAMMSWMREFNPPTNETDKTVAITYLQGERTKVEAVKEKMNTAIAAGKQVADKYSAQP